MRLAQLVTALHAAPGLRLKRDIAGVAAHLPELSRAEWLTAGTCVRNGDDAAAIPDGDGYVLIAAEGMLGSFVAADPWFAGFSSLMVNVSDILAMGGRPYAVVDVLFTHEHAACDQLLAGMREAARLFGVPIVGGHTSRSRHAEQSLAVAIVGRARKLITSFDARPGDDLLFAVDLRGSYRSDTNYFDAASHADATRLRSAAEVLPNLAEAELVRAGKDVSMAGFAGTLTMLCEGSGVGATLELERLPRPDDASLARWLTTFPSYGFVLAVAPQHSEVVCARFAARGIQCARAGAFDDSRRVTLQLGEERETFWDLTKQGLTGFGKIHQSAP